MPYTKAAILQAKRLLDFRSPQAAAMWAGDQREAMAGVSRSEEKHWRMVEDAIIHLIHTGALPNA